MKFFLYGPQITAQILQVDKFLCTNQTRKERKVKCRAEISPLLCSFFQLGPSPNLFSELSPNHPGNCNLLSYTLAPKMSSVSQSDELKTTPHIC